MNNKRWEVVLSILRGLLAFCVLALGTVAAAAQQLTVALNAGETYTIAGVDAAIMPRVSFSGGPAFEIENPTGKALVILALQRGEGTVSFELAGEPVVYRVVVSGIVNPANRLAPAPAPTSIRDSGLSGSASGSSGRGPAPAAVAPVGRPALYSAAAPGPGAATAPGPALASPPTPPALANPPPPLLGGQNFAPPPRRYSTDPSANPTRELPNHELPPGVLSMVAGTSRVFEFPAGVSRVAISDSKVADLQVVDPTQVMVTAHSAGNATLIVWDRDGQFVEREMRIENAGQEQVLLNVIVAEVDRTRLEQQGIDVSVAFTKLGLSIASLPGMVSSAYTSSQNINYGFPGFIPPGGSYLPLTVSNLLTYAIAGQNSNVSTNAFFQFLEQHDLARILAEPNLLARSGQEATFLSGGEIPIIVSQALNTSIVFKEYGTSVSFLPTVIDRHHIELVIKPEVSQPDYTHEVSLNGYTVPAFVTRRAQTTVHVGDDQTLLIAGLMMDNRTSQIKKVPYFGDLPYVGAMFRNTSWSDDKTELVISVTPRVVEPIPAGGQLSLPTDRNETLLPQDVRTGSVSPPDVSRQRLY